MISFARMWVLTGSWGHARGDPAAMASRVKEDERHERIIRGLLKLPANKRCINCNNLVSPFARISRPRLLNVDGFWPFGDGKLEGGRFLCFFGLALGSASSTAMLHCSLLLGKWCTNIIPLGFDVLLGCLRFRPPCGME